jgi:ABC-type phosphate/phosphonate transport system substrate-binding protein
MFAALLLSAAAPAAPITLATYAYPRYDRARALEPLSALIGRALKRKVRVVLYPTPDALRDAVLAGEADIAMTNLASFLGMRAGRGVRSVALLDVPGATLDRYRGVLLARREAIVSAGQLRERATALRYAEVLPGSTSGALVQRRWLRQAGMPEFRETRQAGTHDAALKRLLDGEADIAALAEEPWRKLKAEQSVRAAALVELWRSDPLPPGPVICVQSPRMHCDRIGALLLSTKAKPAASALAAGWSETEGAVSFRAVRPRDYSAFGAKIRR